METIMSKTKGKEKDYISGLPDELLHHILSLLPSTIEAIRTCVLSKRWRLVWTHVPSLIFPKEEFSDSSCEDIISCIDKTLTLHSAPKVDKIFLEHDDYMEGDLLCPRLDCWLLSAVEREVKDLTLMMYTEMAEEGGGCSDGYCLPQFLYHNSSLVKLNTRFCRFTPKGRVSWESLKHLSISLIDLTDQLIENILQGTLLLHSLEISGCYGFRRIDLSHNTHLKTLVIKDFGLYANDSGSLLKISCPYLEDLKILGTWDDMNLEFINISSFVRVTLDFEMSESPNYCEGHYQKIVKKLLQNVSHTNQLTLGNWCVQLLSKWTESVMSSLSSTRQNLILNISRLDLEWMCGIENLLLSSHELEKLVINLGYNHNQYLSDTIIPDCSWSPYGEAFSCLEYHLKTVEITGFDKSACSHEYGYDFFTFLFAKSKVLKCMVIFPSKKKDGHI